MVEKKLDTQTLATNRELNSDVDITDRRRKGRLQQRYTDKRFR